MIKLSRLNSVLLAVLLTFLAMAPAQAEEQQDRLIEMHCMKSKQPDYEEVEKEIWQPIHQAMIDSGDKVWWGLFRVTYGDRSQCDYYTVDIYTTDQLNAGPNWDVAMEKAHPGVDFATYWQRTYNAREDVSTTLWRQLDTSGMSDYQFMKLNWMKAPAGKEDDYVAMEQQYFKPIFRKMLEDGAIGGWNMAKLVAPEGSSLPYNFITTDHWQSPEPPPFMEALAAVHPKLKAEKLFRMAEEARDLVVSQTLYLVASTKRLGQEGQVQLSLSDKQ